MAKTPKKHRLSAVSRVMLLLAALSLITGTAAAYLVTYSNEIQNIFTAETQVNPSVSETFSDNVKKNVTVQAGDPGYAVYVRAAVVVTWKKVENGQELVWGVAPKTDAYSLAIGDGWKKGTDGFYYYLEPVASGGSTGELITECKPLVPAPETGYTLSVEIMTQTIQALGTTDVGEIPAVQDAWGVGVGGDGKLILPQ